MKNWGPDNNPNNWSNVGGCFVKHPFNAENRAACEQSYLAANPRTLQAQADLALAQAAGDSARSQNEGQWTATQTAMVAVGSILAIGLVAVIIVKAKKAK